MVEVERLVDWVFGSLKRVSGVGDGVVWAEDVCGLGKMGQDGDMISTGLVSVTFRKLSPGQVIEFCVKGGLDGIEWGGDVHVPPGDLLLAGKIGEWTRGAGLKVASYGSYYRAGHGEVRFDDVLETALELGAPNVRVWCGKKGSDESDSAYRKMIADDLCVIAGKAAARGVTVSCEYHRWTLTDTVESSVALLKQVGHPNLRIYWQPRHGVETAASVGEIGELSLWLGNIHVFHWWPTSENRFPLEEGAGRWVEFLRKINSIQGDRYALLEFAKNDDSEIFLRDAACLKRLLSECAASHDKK